MWVFNPRGVRLWAGRASLRRDVVACPERDLVRGSARGRGSAFVKLEAPVDHEAEPDAAEEARRQGGEYQRDEEGLIDDADAIGKARQHNTGPAPRRHR